MKATDRPNKIENVIAIVNMLFPDDGMLDSSAYEVVLGAIFLFTVVVSLYFSNLLILT